MQTVYKKLAVAKEADSTLTANIILDIPTLPPMLATINSTTTKSGIKSMKVDKQNTNIFPFFTGLYLAVKTVLDNELMYPHGGSFFKGYKGREDRKKLSRYLIEKAVSSNGTQVVTSESQNKYTHNTNLILTPI